MNDLPEQIKAVYVDNDSFKIVSIITALLAYVFIIAYKTNPYFNLVLPFQGKKQEKLDAYYQKSQLLVNLSSNVTDENKKTLEKLIKKINVTEPKKIYKISYDKFVSRGVGILVISILIFLGIGLANVDTWILSLAQAISYITSIIMAVLILTIYRDKVISNKEWKENEKEKNKKAIRLAVIHNSIDNYPPEPKVKFISSFPSEGFPSNLHTWVEFENKKYEIITDLNAEKLIKVTEIDI